MASEDQNVCAMN